MCIAFAYLHMSLDLNHSQEKLIESQFSSFNNFLVCTTFQALCAKSVSITEMEHPQRVHMGR